MPIPVVIALVVASGFLGSHIGVGVRASFVSSSTSTTGSLTFARLTGSFAAGTDDLGATGGVGGSTYVMTVTALALGASTHRFTTLTNTGSVTAAFTGTITPTGASGTMNVAVDSCSQAWASGLCGGSTTSLRSATALSGAPSVTYGSLAVNAVKFLRYTFTSTSTLASAVATAAAVPTGTGTGDRTAG
ncbi:MAG: hypothetical protein M3N21_04375 [Actinomycetota bacterium]|nr:hypothetical protein [Actinomycetota bacterium]